MSQEPTLPEDPLGRFREIYDALNAERRWWGDPSTLRFAAVSAITCPGDAASVAAAIRRMGDDIKAESGWFGPLNTNLRFIVGAMLLLHGDSAADFLTEVKRVRELFRDADLRRAGIYETMAILILRIQAEKRPVNVEAVTRFRAIYEEMKHHHWWLTGPDDFPACAILTGQQAEPVQIGRDIEAIYQALRDQDFSRGDPLQTAANILYLSRLSPEEIALRYGGLAAGFKNAGVSIWQSDYDELAILSFLDHPPGRIVEHVLRHREVMESLKPKPDRSLTFNLAASTTFLELVRLDADLKTVTDAKALLDMQAIINAQQAAVIAATSSAVAASTAAGAG
ncbi:MAG: DUF4003 family protein [Phycisphaerae bacterium]